MIQPKHLRSFSECWLFGHAWEYGVATHTPRLEGAVPVLLRCVRCNTERRESWSLGSGGLLSRGYRYPEGYSLAERVTNVPRPSREDLRLMVLADRQTRARIRR